MNNDEVDDGTMYNTVVDATINEEEEKEEDEDCGYNKNIIDCRENDQIIHLR